jgi:hemerythrin
MEPDDSDGPKTGKGGRKMACEWREDLATGNPEIDSQHKELFKRLNALIAAGNERKADAEVGNLLQFLKKYVLVHFATEEQLQLKHGYPNYKAHKSQHDAFIKELHAVEEQFATQGASLLLVQKTSRIAFDWLVNHIFNLDKEMAGFVNRAQKGPGYGMDSGTP